MCYVKFNKQKLKKNHCVTNNYVALLSGSVDLMYTKEYKSTCTHVHYSVHNLYCYMYMYMWATISYQFDFLILIHIIMM